MGNPVKGCSLHDLSKILPLCLCLINQRGRMHSTPGTNTHPGETPDTQVHMCIFRSLITFNAVYALIPQVRRAPIVPVTSEYPSSHTLV